MRIPCLGVLLAVAVPAVAQEREEPAFRNQVWTSGVKAPDWRSERPQWTTAFDTALAALLARQRGDGTFAATDKAGPPTETAIADTAAMALAIVAIEAGGSTMRVGPNKQQVMNAVRALRSQQREDGWFVDPARPDAPLAQALAALAMTRTMLESRYQLLKSTAVRGMRAATTGVTTEKLDPLSLALALPLAGRPSAVGDFGPQANEWCGQAVQSLGAVLGPRGQITWQGPRPTMSSALPQFEEVATLVLLATPTDAVPPAIAERLAHARTLLELLPKRWTKAEDLDGLSLAFGCTAAARAGGEVWTTWQGIVDQKMLGLQRKDGDHPGTFEFTAGPDLLANPTASTALAMLALAADVAK